MSSIQPWALCVRLCVCVFVCVKLHFGGYLTPGSHNKPVQSSTGTGRIHHIYQGKFFYFLFYFNVKTEVHWGLIEIIYGVILKFWKCSILSDLLLEVQESYDKKYIGCYVNWHISNYHIMSNFHHVCKKILSLCFLVPRIPKCFVTFFVWCSAKVVNL